MKLIKLNGRHLHFLMQRSPRHPELKTQPGTIDCAHKNIVTWYMMLKLTNNNAKVQKDERLVQCYQGN